MPRWPFAWSGSNTPTLPDKIFEQLEKMVAVEIGDGIVVRLRTAGSASRSPRRERCAEIAARWAIGPVTRNAAAAVISRHPCPIDADRTDDRKPSLMDLKDMVEDDIIEEDSGNLRVREPRQATLLFEKLARMKLFEKLTRTKRRD